jgi:LysM repeat protein
VNNCLIHIGDKLLIPVPTPTAGPSPTLPPGVTQQPSGTPESTATMPPQLIYQVKGGDTCSEIAQKYRMTVDQLIAQNSLDANCTLQIGQVLTLTFDIPTPAVSPTPNIAQTPTPRVGYEPPQLTSPRDGEQFSETQEVVTLQWLSTGLLKDDEWYVVQVQPSGAITVPVFETKATSIKLTRDIFGDQSERSFAWWVQVKQLLGVNTQTGERAYNNLSEPSLVRRFTWRRPQTTPTPAAANP